MLSPQYKLFGLPQKEELVKALKLPERPVAVSPYKMFGLQTADTLVKKGTQDWANRGEIGKFLGGDQPKEYVGMADPKNNMTRAVPLPNIDPTGMVGLTEKVGAKAADPIIDTAFKGFTDLSTKLLEKLKGRTTVSRQFIEDLTNAPDLKQAERDLIRNAVKDEGDTINIPDFANRVKSELLPLTRSGASDLMGSFAGRDQATGGIVSRPVRYENIVLPDELRGPVANYNEHIYQSPIKTSAGNVHWGAHHRAENVDSYFAHSRIEDLPTKGDEIYGGDNYSAATNALAKGEPTRRVIEIQSDLFQKGRLEGEKLRVGRNADGTWGVMGLKSNNRGQSFSEKLANFDTEEEAIKWIEKNDPTAKLEPYRNTWHERVIREEVKQAAKDGKTKLQFPTGETAMKIEGLGEQGDNMWADIGHYVDGDEAILQGPGDTLSPDQLKIGQKIARVDNDMGTFDPEDSWIITDVLGDGKFKAVQKDFYDKVKDGFDPYKGSKSEREIWDSNSETFDISGKVDTENPIYKFYEKQVQKYLTNKYGGKVVTDPQGVKWVEIDIKPEMARVPVEAFGAAGIPFLGNKDEWQPVDGTDFEEKKPSLLDKVTGKSEIRRVKKQTYELPDRGVSLDDKDIEELRNVLYSEISNRNPEKQKLESRVIINTALNRHGQYKQKGRDLTVADILREPNQYQGFQPDNSKSQYRVAKEGRGNTAKLAAIDAVLEELKSGKLKDTTNGAVYYVHEDDGRITIKPGKLYKDS